MQEFPGRYELPTLKGDVIAFNTRIWHSSWGGGANRRQMAWMMRTKPRMAWEIERIVTFNKSYAEMWAPDTGRLISDRFFETAGPNRMKKIQLLKELGVVNTVISDDKNKEKTIDCSKRIFLMGKKFIYQSRFPRLLNPPR